MTQEFRKRARASMEGSGMSSMTQKLVIRAVEVDESKGTSRIVEYKAYLVTGWFENQLNYLEIYLGGMYPYSLRDAVGRVCKLTRAVLRYEVPGWDVDRVIAEWLATAGNSGGTEPYGFCPQLKDLHHPNPQVKGVMDAVARILDLRKQDWSKGIRARGQ